MSRPPHERRGNTLDLRKLTFAPLTSDRWSDLERLFGERGACAGCWCMYWRMGHSEFERGKGDGNREAMKQLVARGEIPGLLAYVGSEPIGWCAVAPRETYPRLERSRILAPIDDEKVWSIVCLFVARQFRHCGLSTALITAVVEHVRGQGGKVVEAYPVDPKKFPVADAFVWTGLASAFRAAGFNEKTRRSPTRPLVRRST